MKFSISAVNEFFRSKGSFFHGIATVMTGTVLSRLIALAAIPFVSRMYTPAEFGVLALFTMVVVMVACIGSGRYEVALVLPDDDRDAMHLLFVGVGVATLVSVITALAFLVWNEDVASFLGAEELNFWLLICPVAIWAYVIANLMQFWIVRKKAFHNITISDVTAASTNVTGQVSLYFLFNPGAAGLIIGNILQHVAAMLVLGRGALKTISRADIRSFSPKRAWQMAVRYKNFPLFDTWANLLNTLSREMPILVLGAFFTAGVVGLYSVAYRIMVMPVTVVSTAVTRVYLAEAKTSFSKGELDKLALQMLRNLLLIAVTPVLLMIVAAPEVVVLVLGDQWDGAGIYVQWVSVFILMLFIILPLLQTLVILEKQRQRLVYQMVLAAARLGRLLIGGLLADPVLAVALTSVAGAAVMLVTVVIVMRYTGVAVSTSFGAFTAEFLKSAPFALVLLAVKQISPGEWTVLAAFIGLLLLFTVARLRTMLTGAGATST